MIESIKKKGVIGLGLLLVLGSIGIVFVIWAALNWPDDVNQRLNLVLENITFVLLITSGTYLGGEGFKMLAELWLKKREEEGKEEGRKEGEEAGRKAGEEVGRKAGEEAGKEEALEILQHIASTGEDGKVTITFDSMEEMKKRVLEKKPSEK